MLSRIMLPLRKAVLFLGRAYLLLFHHDLAILTSSDYDRESELGHQLFRILLKNSPIASNWVPSSLHTSLPCD